MSELHSTLPGGRYPRSYQIAVGMGTVTLVGGISGVTGVTAASDAAVMAGAGMVYSGGLKIVGPAALSARGSAWGVDAASGEFGLDNFVPGVGAVKAYHTIAENC